MDDQALKNIFRPEEVRTSYCRVIRRMLATRYEVKDAIGRIMIVESTDFYPPGVSVVVQDDRIVGRGTAAGKHRVYDV